MSTEPLVRVETDEALKLCTLTLNRPKQLNSLNTNVFEELIAAMKGMARRKDINTIVLTGAGEKAFSAGNDLKGMSSNSVAQAALKSIEEARQCVICVVSGLAFTGAIELILACDIVVASSTAYFQDTHAKLGLVPTWGGNMRLPRKIGINSAKEFLLTGARWDAYEMQRRGLVNRVVEQSELMATARAMAGQMAQNSGDSIAKQKKLMNGGWNMALGDALEMLNSRFHPGHADDMAERMRAGPVKSKL
mmetsp:Transcript_20365/g.63852  ORF Transcript_20365/g.63852 Transcript_20365/m.63852 type:complete len:249 (+) Transcript_20365:122-868(+)|eukprot:CAMPEP_0204569600 /NCGR_PEP_ID=MMETSP0661-20131031/37833_1 /ASSEMBLY_ACC=CAM_ASM_000606 /TAXON_ID=109239 /ORGANISM="Alexandrium margalefi, Strain AMGDE01CS-322" /LENGTH=248 /DNA_ID=CAMNT_0051577717 /DNA_START=105 /DNA_END=851 /DNA_ORIENTATION=+